MEYSQHQDRGCRKRKSKLNKKQTYKRTNIRLVGGLTGIFCSKCQDHVIRFSRPNFDRKIDLKWFRDDWTEFYGSKSQKIDIPP